MLTDWNKLVFADKKFQTTGAALEIDAYSQVGWNSEYSGGTADDQRRPCWKNCLMAGNDVGSTLYVSSDTLMRYLTGSQ